MSCPLMQVITVSDVRDISAHITCVSLEAVRYKLRITESTYAPASLVSPASTAISVTRAQATALTEAAAAWIAWPSGSAHVHSARVVKGKHVFICKTFCRQGVPSRECPAESPRQRSESAIIGSQ